MSEDTPSQRFRWTGYTTLQAAEGPVTLATRKEAVGADQAILTNELALPSSPPEGAFTNPDPMLASDDTGDS
jgi:hypothetical protein